MLIELTNQERELLGFVLCDTVLQQCRKAISLPHSDPDRARTIIVTAVLNDVLSKLTMTESITLTGENA